MATIEAKLIGPEEAAKLLSTNKMNRNISLPNLNSIMKSMIQNEFVPADSIKIGSDGKLQDGQHRLLAIVKTGKTYNIPIVRNLDPEDFVKWDTGKKRSSADVMQISGYKQPLQVAAVGRVLYEYYNHQRTLRRAFFTRTENYEMLEFLGPAGSGGDGDKIAYAINMVESKVLFRIMAKTTAAFCYMIFLEKNDELLVADFFDKLKTGTLLNQYDPILTLRNLLTNTRIANGKRGNKTPIEWAIAVTIKAWNAYLTDKPLKIIYWKPNESFPQVMSQKNMRRRRSHGTQENGMGSGVAARSVPFQDAELPMQ